MKSFDYYSGKDLVFPRKPQKPVLSENPTPEEVRQYADRLEECEIEFDKYLELAKEYYKILNAREAEFRNDVRSKYCPEFSDEVFDIIYNKAWEDGHSSGHHRVVELVDELSCFVLEIMDKIK